MNFLNTLKEGKFLFRSSIFLLCAWVLLPLYLLLINSLSSPEAVNSFPKSFIPEFNIQSLYFFYKYQGMLDALINSILVAGLTMVIAIGIGAPAGYALSRFEFVGSGTFKVLILLTIYFLAKIY